MPELRSYQSIQQFIWPRSYSPRSADQQVVEQIHACQRGLTSVSDDGLKDRFGELKSQAGAGGKCITGTFVVSAFALISESVRRVLGLSLYDVQLLAGISLATGAIAEMQTGEGKTLAASLPAALHALTGKGVHVATPNSYLAQRDYEQLAPVYALLGLTTGLVVESQSPEMKRVAYRCDITYAAGYELGFDFLRDQLARIAFSQAPLGATFRRRLKGLEPPASASLQRGNSLAIIDEIDAVLIDEACLPLVLSTATPSVAEDSSAYQQADELARQLERGSDFIIDETLRTIGWTERGMKTVRQTVGYSRRVVRPWLNYVQQALHAHWLLAQDSDYILVDNRVQLVDRNTGRILSDRRFQHGLHQAIEAKEGLPISAEECSAARISRQRYFRLYERICGMTGTTAGSEREFWALYRLPIVRIPPRKPCQRQVLPDRYFLDRDSKFIAIVEETLRYHRLGQPVLIGTRTIENSELLARRLAQAGLAFQLLTGKQDVDEARVIAHAGQCRAITVATNMAGRGTDIKLGPGVAQMGGLHLIGAERNESQRVDRQLIGRVSRQGDPGSARFFVCATDDLVRQFGADVAHLMQQMPNERGELSASLAHAIAKVQRRAEAHRANERRRLLAYDRWLEDITERLYRP